MGSRFDLTISAQDSVSAEKFIDESIAEISRIEDLISEWRPNTEVSLINQNAGVKPVPVSKEVFELTRRALYFSQISNGAFDISVASGDKIWKFDGSMTTLPSEEVVRRSVERIGYQHIILDQEKQTIFLKLAGMKIGFGSIGKGYAADKTRELMISKGVTSGIINASGDMSAWGKQPDGQPWTVGITNPINRNKVFAVLPLESSVVTSGNYEKFAIIDGKRYAHIINPKTGYPATGVSSVTVFGDSAATANGFSTAIMVMGKDAGLELINRFPEFRCIIVSDKGEVFGSDNVQITPNQK